MRKFHRHLLAIAAAFGLSGGAAAEPYLLAAEDVVTLKVASWDEQTSNYVPMDAIAGEYKVSTEGHVSLPIVGRVEAAGLTVDAVGDSVAQRLKDSVGLFQLPVVSLQIASYRPFYIVGAIDHPGSYDWRPGMTPMKAIALSGGILRSSPEITDETRAYRETNALRGVQLELARQQARLARLEAELSGAETISFPEPFDHPDGPDSVARLEAEETALLGIRREATERATSSNQALIELYRTELAGLEGKMSGLRRQIELATGQLENTKAMVESGSVPANRLITAEQAVADLNAEELDLITAMFRARQRIGEAERDLLQMSDNRQQEVMNQMQIARHEIALQSSREQMLKSLAVLNGLTPVDAAFSIETIVRREVVGTTTSMSIGPDDPIMPDDVVEVRLVPDLPTQ